MLGVQSIDESYPRAAACLGAGKWQIFRHVVIPGALPYIFTGLQISVGVAWFSLVAAEMVSGEYGLGYLINYSRTWFQVDNMMLGAVVIGALGITSNYLLVALERHLFRWRVTSR